MFNFFLQNVYFWPTFVGFSFEMKEDMTITWTITPLDKFLTIADTRCILNSNFRSRMSKYDTIYTTYRLYTLKCLTENVTTCTFFVSNRWTTLCSVSAHAVCKWNKYRSNIRDVRGRWSTKDTTFFKIWKRFLRGLICYWFLNCRTKMSPC